ncbi:hypothetical protein DFH08DRAFT_1013957 [Mycena albidolilacea]|uniref:Uncharacterized protein n=1 Tax=Mycena albidolilacea TaxID=1033008 RepID=A0AAD6ZTL9_9AGAR|nr:hypothetical protein DFH08DRAFT_1013957 [Mycena albidolilacea]
MPCNSILGSADGLCDSYACSLPLLTARRLDLWRHPSPHTNKRNITATTKAQRRIKGLRDFVHRSSSDQLVQHTDDPKPQKFGIVRICEKIGQIEELVHRYELEAHLKSLFTIYHFSVHIVDPGQTTKAQRRIKGLRDFVHRSSSDQLVQHTDDPKPQKFGIVRICEKIGQIEELVHRYELEAHLKSLWALGLSDELSPEYLEQR